VSSTGEGLSTQVRVGPDQGLKRESWIMCDNLVSLRKAQLTDYVCAISGALERELNRALRSALGLL
jgi:mRNA-degrading endonuclease toxin of MazEF toxin-antitoxin module